MASSLVTPLLISQPFGASAANPAYINLPIPVPSQIATTVNAASFTDGFPPSTMTPEESGGLPFFGQDMNGILWMVTAYCANFAAGAFAQYNSTLSTDISGYPEGAIVVNANQNGLWLNTTNGNTTNPDSSGAAGWLPIALTKHNVITLTEGTVTLSQQQAAFPLIAFNGTLTGNVTVVFPNNEGQSWIAAAYTTGGYTISLVGASGGNTINLVSGSGYANAQNIFSDGEQLWSNNVSTAGLAPLASPAFTGTPTAPTNSNAATSTTQIATTAFVQAALVAALAAYAPKASPIFTGTPAAPTASAGTNTTQLATTAFVTAAVAAATQTIVKAGGIALTNGSNSVNFAAVFGSAFPNSCSAVTLTPIGAEAEYFLTGSPSKTGFTCDVGVTQSYMCIAVGN